MFIQSDELEKEEMMQKEIFHLRDDKKIRKEKYRELQKILNKEDSENNDITKKFNHIMKKRNKYELKLQEINRKSEEYRSKTVNNYGDRESKLKLEKKVKEIFENHFNDSIKIEEIKLKEYKTIKTNNKTNTNDNNDVDINFRYQNNLVNIKMDDRFDSFEDLKETIGSYFFLSKDLIYFKDPMGNLLIPKLKIKETLFSDYFAYFKNYTPTIDVILRNDLKFDEIILENLKDYDNLPSEQENLIENNMQTAFMTPEKSSRERMALFNSVVDTIQEKSTGYIKDLFQFFLRILFMLVVILYIIKKLDLVNLHESEKLTKFKDITYLITNDLENYLNLTDNVMMNTYFFKIFLQDSIIILTGSLLRPLNKMLLVQKRSLSSPCTITPEKYKENNFNYECIDYKTNDESPILNDSTKSYNIYQSKYGFEGFLYEGELVYEYEPEYEMNIFVIKSPWNITDGWFDPRTTSVTCITNFVNPQNNFLVIQEISLTFFYPDIGFRYYKLESKIYKQNLNYKTDYTDKLQLAIDTISYFVLVIIFFQRIMILNEHSLDPRVILYKEKEKEKKIKKKNKGNINIQNGMHIPEDNIKKIKKNYLIFKIHCGSFNKFLILLAPNVSWIFTTTSILYIIFERGRREGILDEIKSSIVKEPNQFHNFTDDINNLRILTICDGIIILLSFLSFAYEISQNRIMKYYAEMIIKAFRNIFVFFLIIIIFNSCMAIIFRYHVLGQVNTNYSDFVNLFLFFLGLSEKTGFWSFAYYDSTSTDSSILDHFLTHFIILFVIFISRYLIFSVLVAIDTKFIHQSRIQAKIQRELLLKNTHKAIKFKKKRKKIIG